MTQTPTISPASRADAPTPSAPLEDRYHYKVIQRAIAAIDAAQSPASLEDLARDLGMSPAHFQRTFSRWAGVSPKRYQQFLTLGHAKTLIRNHHSTLETANSVGLSGTGRLHDLFVRWEAMSPGEYARGGAGLTLSAGWFDTPFGRVLAMASDKGLCGMGFASESSEDAIWADLCGRWEAATVVENPAKVAPFVAAAFGEADLSKAQLHLIGAPFQIKVWEALMSIPSGQVTTYGALAKAIGKPGAARAVGTAVGRNPIGWLIPCHRVLRASGEMGGYHWGQPIKRAMLAYESSQNDMAPAP